MSFSQHSRDLIMHLQSKDRSRLLDQLADLCDRNAQVGGSPGGFQFQGERFNHPHNPTPRAHVQWIHESLEPELETWIRFRDRMEHDKRKMLGALSVISARCTSPQDFRDALPEALVRGTALAALPRIKEPGFLLEDHPLLAGQFEKIRETINFYGATELLF